MFSLFLGNIPDGIEHLCTAVAMCTAPEQLLSILRETLTPQLFDMLIQTLPGVQEVIVKKINISVIIFYVIL